MSDAAAPADRVTALLVPHTHWDREWYEPFQRFRLRLVDLLDDVLTRAESDPRFHFTLDGQTALVDDYLEVRPDAESRLTALVRSGQLAVGPWQILLDEFLCSGENIIRNLQRGSARAAELGGAMPVGYLPDMFGHIAQMPQILARAGLRHACLWRGVPASIDHHSFRWEAPDGSSVRTEYLPGGYGNAAVLLVEPDRDRVVERTQNLLTRMRPWFGTDQPLAMYGADHSTPLPELLSLMEDLDNSDAPVRLQITTLARYFAELNPDASHLLGWRGELRSHARANVLPGVLSTRIHLKKALGAAERMVERYAEPLAALWLSSWPQDFLDLAWSRLVGASGHDSVTGCGADETAAQVAARIAEAEQLGQAVRDKVAAKIAADAPMATVVVLNPTPEQRGGMVRCDVVVPEQWASVAFELPDGTKVAAQEVTRAERVLLSQTFSGEALVDAVRRRTFGQEMFGRKVVSHEIDADAPTPSVTFTVSPAVGDHSYDLDRVTARLAEAVARRPWQSWLMRIVDAPQRTLLTDIPAPPLGWTSVRPVEGAAATRTPPVVVDPMTGALDNGMVHVQVSTNGTLRVSSRSGVVLDNVGMIADGGDAGDSYNYAPPYSDLVVDIPDSVSVIPAAPGPVVGSFVLHRTYRWPAGLTPDRQARSPEPVPTAVTTRVELRTGEPFVRLTVEFDNRCVDHRARVYVPTAWQTASSCAEGQFAVVERGPTPEGGNGEEPVATYPAYSFVDAGGAALLLDHATEYELLDGRMLALTALRATGQISRNIHRYRAEPAGPELPTPQAQCLGPVSMRFAVMPHAGTWQEAGVPGAAERFRHDLHAVLGRGKPGGSLWTQPGLSVTGAGVVMTSLIRRADWLELRVVAERNEPTRATIAGAVTEARRADLLGQPGEPLAVADGRVELPLSPWEIATIQLRLAERA